MVALVALALAGGAAAPAVTAAAPLVRSSVGAGPIARAAAAPGAGPIATVARAKRCAAVAPSRITLRRDLGRTVGTLRWRAPRRAGTLRYRVTRGKDVVGQTRKRKMRVRVRIGARHRFTVTPIRDGKALPRCHAVRRIAVRYQRPGAPHGLSAKLDAGVVRLAWKASRRGDRPVSSYRVYRDGRALGVVRGLSRDVRVASNRSYRFTVAAVDRRGKRGAMSAPVLVETGHQRPPAPTGVTATVISPTEVAVSWQPSAPARGSIVGYRVLRNGATVGQVAGTETKLEGLPPSTAVTVTVAAVDSLGEVSDTSAPVTVRTFDAPGKAPGPAAGTGGSGGGGGPSAPAEPAPPTPANLKAKVLSDSEVELTWEPSIATQGRVVGYRVLRNGVVLGQYADTKLTVTNLPPATDLTFTVAAVTSRGTLSAESAPVKVRTNDPPPTTGSVHAFLLATTDESFADFRAHYRQIGTVYPTYYDCTGGAQLEGRDDPLVTQWAQLRKVKVLARINCQRTAVLTKILRDPATRKQWLDQLEALTEEHGYDGLALDFEAGLPEDRDAYTSFVTDLAAALHAQGRKLTVAVSAKTADNPDHIRSGFFDYVALDDHVDTMFVMDWGIHWATSGPGAQDDLPWATKVADYVASLDTKHKYVLGTQLYGMDWPAGGGPSNPGTAYQYGELMERLKAAGATPRHDPEVDAWYATYTDADGVKHDVWYADATTVATRIRLAHDRGLAGVGFWRLGREDQRMWDDPLLAPGAEW